jgi:hypothetical protein
VPEPIILPTTFNDDDNAGAPDIYNLVELVLLKFYVDVACKLLIDKTELVDNEFKSWNVVVDVAFKLFIDKIELVDNEFKSLNIVVDVAF